MQDTIRYSITGDDVAQQFFYINADTGAITLKQLLSQDTTSKYTVSNLFWSFICLLNEQCLVIT